MQIIVFGATGIIGRRVIPLLAARGHRMTAVGRNPQRLARLAAHGVTTATVDLFDPADVARAVRGHAVVINLATSIPTPGLRAFLPGAWKETDRIRVQGSRNIADAATAAGVERLIQESFGYAYPDSGAGWVDESVPLRPAKYNRTIVDAERSSRRFSESGRVGVALRFTLLYGGAEDPFTADVVRNVRRGVLPLFGREDAYISLVTHDDAAAAVVAALDAPAGVYNVCDNEPVTRGDLARALGAMLGVPTPRLLPRWTEMLAGSIGETISRSLRLSNRALRQATGWSPVHATATLGPWISPT
jgi:2-alkyl-3-oxoalkanoate reductase